VASAAQTAIPAPHRRSAGLDRRSSQDKSTKCLRCDGQILSRFPPIKPALPLNTLSNWGRAPIKSNLSAAQYAPRLSPFVESLHSKNGGARGVDLSPSLHGVADGSSGNLQLPTSPGWADWFEASDVFTLRGSAPRALSTLARVRVRSCGGRPRKLVGDARTALTALRASPTS
jgi:hypothetical protein